MRKQKKVERAVAGLQEWLAKAGVQQEIIAVAAEHTELTRQDKSLQAEGVLLFLQKPMGFVTKLCRWCEQPFETNYRSVAYCSDDHRAKALKRDGIIWSPYKSAEERWGGEPPLVIPPEARKRLLEWAKILVEKESEIPEHPPEIGSPGLSLGPASISPEMMNAEPDPQLVNEILDEMGQSSDLLDRMVFGVPTQQESHQQTSETRTSPGLSLPSLDDLLG